MSGFDSTVRALVQARAGGRCERCGAAVTGGRGDVHHRKPRRMGGSTRDGVNAASNLVHLCRVCHDTVESYRAQAIVDGWLIESWGDDPADIPFVLHSLCMKVWTDTVGCYLLDRPERTAA